MSWIHESGYGPALDHEGGVADVLEAGTDPSTPPDQIGPRVIGWRSACQCGWRGAQFYLRSEWPTTDEFARSPEEVDARCMADWERHLRVVMPVLAIHDIARQIAQAQDDLDHAVMAARALGVSWTEIGEAAGTGGTSDGGTGVHRDADPAAEDAMAPEENVRTVRRLVEDAVNADRGELLEQFVRTDVRVHPGTPGAAPDTVGVDELAAAFRGFHTTFPDLHVRIEDIVADDDRVAARWVARGTHSAELAGIAATGRRVTWGGTDIYRLVDGKVAEWWRNDDTAFLLDQLRRPVGGIVEG